MKPPIDAGEQPPKRGKGRPTSFSADAAAEICKRLSAGEPLAVICRDEHLPAVRTISDWKANNPTFSADFACARDEGFEAIAAQCMEISDDERHDWKLSKKGVLLNEVAIGRARLRVETRLKLLAKWDPKRYGDKIQQDIKHAGDFHVVIGGNPDSE